MGFQSLAERLGISLTDAEGAWMTTNLDQKQRVQNVLFPDWAKNTTPKKEF